MCKTFSLSERCLTVRFLARKVIIVLMTESDVLFNLESSACC